MKSCLGHVATQNTNYLQFTFTKTIRWCHAGAIIATVPAVALLLWMCKDALMGPVHNYAKVLSDTKHYKITNWDLFAKSGMLYGSTCRLTAL